MNRPTITQKRRAFSKAAILATLVVGCGLTTPARAQFSWFGPSEASPQDVYDTITGHGFRIVGPLYRNGRVYVADVIDRRQRRERLVVSADSGQIVQRFFVDVGAPERRLAERTRPQPRDDDSFFSHLTRGWDNDEPAPRPPLSLPSQPNQDLVQPPVVLPRAKARTEPRVVTRTDPAPVTATPLAPVPAPERKPDSPSGTTATASPATVSPAPAGAAHATTVVNDPLRIPGSHKPDEAKPASAAAAVATAKPPEPPKPAPVKPTDVPVAPLD